VPGPYLYLNGVNRVRGIHLES